jgi:hypothetical protein
MKEVGKTGVKINRPLPGQTQSGQIYHNSPRLHQILISAPNAVGKHINEK